MLYDNDPRRQPHRPIWPEDRAVGRDPVGKTLVELVVRDHPDFTNQQVAEHIRKHTGCDAAVMTAEIVARWRP